jgi:uncharacterized protein (TIGR02646 family)
MITSRDFRKYKQELLEEFDRKCAYCGSPLGLTDNGHVEHFYPKSEYPERMLDADNLLIVCQICNISKAAFFPLDDDGNPILLNPRIDDFTTHIELQIDGTYVGLTERGTLTIDTLNLNRPQLVERRRYELYESQYYADRDDPVDVFKVFHDSLEKIALLNSMHLENANSTEQYFNNLLYANVITALESLLADTFITYVKANKVHLRNFVETFHDFEKEKFNLREVFLKYEGIEEKALQSIRDVIFHNSIVVNFINRKWSKRNSLFGKK